MTVPHRIVDGVIVPLTQAEIDEMAADVAAWEAAQLSRAQRGAVRKVNRESGLAREAYRTIVPGQEETYRIKYDEAKEVYAKWQASQPVTPSDYPMCYAEAQATGQTFVALVTAVLQAEQTWRQKAVQIEAARRKALVQIATALTENEIQAVFPIAWP